MYSLVPIRRHVPINRHTYKGIYAIGARLFLSKVPLEVLQNWLLIQLIVMPHILGKVQGQIKEVCRLIEPCLLIGTREYRLWCIVGTVLMACTLWCQLEDTVQLIGTLLLLDPILFPKYEA